MFRDIDADLLFRMKELRGTNNGTSAVGGFLLWKMSKRAARFTRQLTGDRETGRGGEGGKVIWRMESENSHKRHEQRYMRIYTRTRPG